MNNVAAAWLMEQLTHSALWVSLVPAAVGLPVFAVGLLAGALADRLERRPFLLVFQLLQMLVALAMAVGAWQGWLTPALLLGLLALLGTGSALVVPAWQATTPRLVPAHLLPQAVALNGISVNLSRAVGPALGGVVLAGYGASPVFFLNTLSFVWVIFVLWRWPGLPRPKVSRTSFRAALWGGPRYIRQAPEQAKIMLRTALTAFCGAVQGALLPYYSAQALHLGPSGLGLLYGCIGLGAVAGAQFQGQLRRLGWDGAALIASSLFAVQLLLLSLPGSLWLAGPVLFLGGIGWIGMVTTFSTAAQMAAPAWMQARILSVYALVFQGGLALGSAFWGWLCLRQGLPVALQSAAVGLLLVQALIPWTRLQVASVAAVAAYPEPDIVAPPHPQAGPVRVELAYRVSAEQRSLFLRLIRPLERLRRRDGAYEWTLEESLEQPGLYREHFWLASWAEHEEQHGHAQERDLELLEPLKPFREGGAEHYLRVS